MASWCLQNVIKQKQKTSFHNLCSLEIAHNKLTMSTVVGRHTGLNTKLHFNSIRVHYSGQKRKLTFYLKGMVFNGCPMIFNFLPSAQRFLKHVFILFSPLVMPFSCLLCHFLKKKNQFKLKHLRHMIWFVYLQSTNGKCVHKTMSIFLIKW